MGWREPEPQDVGRVVFNRSFKRTNVEILRNSYLSRHGGEVGGAEQANVYFDQAMKTQGCVKPTFSKTWAGLFGFFTVFLGYNMDTI